MSERSGRVKKVELKRVAPLADAPSINNLDSVRRDQVAALTGSALSYLSASRSTRACDLSGA